jgi:hypothetical protein
MKPKHKTKRDLYSVDFVTALTVDECRDALTQKDLEGSDYSQRAHVGESGTFSVERDVKWGFPPRYGMAFTIQFRGQLGPTDYGTRVHGAITKETLNRLQIGKWGLWVLTAFTLVLALVVAEEPLELFCTVWLLFALILCVFLSYWYVAYTRTNVLVDWVRDQLYVLPPDETEVS